MNKNWRPTDWDTKTPFSFDILRSTFESGASAMLSARDKWWVEMMDCVISAPPCTYDCNTDNDVELISDSCPCSWKQWQLVKKSLELSI